MERVQLFTKYFPELFSLSNSLEDYSLCERHYNQIVASNSLLQTLQAGDFTFTEYGQYKKQKNDNLSQPFLEPKVHDVGIQVSLPDLDLLSELSQTKKKLADSLSQRLEYVDIINEYKKKIHELSLPLSSPSSSSLSSTSTYTKKLEQELKAAYDQIKILNNEKENLIAENNNLKNQFATQFNTQEKRINAIIDIALAERNNIYQDIQKSIKNMERFTLSNLLTYSPTKWLEEQNPVVVKFIEILTNNEYNDQSEQMQEEKIFKRAIALEAIYGSRNCKYVSAINLAISAIKYSLARSKMIVDMDNHIMSSGSYSKFVNWLESLVIEPEPLPDGFLILAFDNEQRGQKNYLDRGNNSVIFHVVTSFVAFNFNPHDNSQLTTNPWKSDSLTSDEIEQLLDIDDDMQREFELELRNFIGDIISNLCNEKNKEKNQLDQLVDNQNNLPNKMKICLNCSEKNIDNKKRNCPNCNEKLPTLDSLNLNQTSQQPSESASSNKEIIFRHHSIKKSEHDAQKSKLSITQRLIPDKGVEVPDIYIPDPIPVNPNSLKNVEIVLKHIENITGIKSGKRKWVPIVCDGVPYNLALKLKNDFPWLILLPGALHEEMNMLKAFVELNW